MAQLDYKLPAHVMTAYGDAMKGVVSDKAKASQNANALANIGAGLAKDVTDRELARRAEVAAAKTKEEEEIEAQTEKNERALNGMQEKFYTQAAKVANGTAELGTDGQDRFREVVVDPLAVLHDEAVLAGDNKEARRIRGLTTALGDNTKKLSASLNLVAENSGKDILDKDSIPEEDWVWMQWVIDVKQSSMNLEADSETGAVYYEMPVEGGDPVRITRDMLEKLNTQYLKPDPATFDKSLDKVAAESKKYAEDYPDKKYVIPTAHMRQVRDSITPNSIRGMMFNKEVWSASSGEADEEGVSLSWFDQWSTQDITIDIKLGDGASQALVDADNAPKDGMLSKEESNAVTLTKADKKALANLLALPENFEEGKAILAAYAKKRLENKVYKEPTETASIGKRINANYA